MRLWLLKDIATPDEGFLPYSDDGLITALVNHIVEYGNIDFEASVWELSDDEDWVRL